MQDMLLVIDGQEEYLIMPPRSEVQNIFDGELDVSNMTKTSGIATILDHEAGWQKLGARLKKEKQVATLKALPEFVDIFGFYANPARAKLYGQMLQKNSKLEITDLRPVLAQLRSIKQSAELQAIQQAIDITAQGFAAVRTKLSELAHEYEIEAILSYEFRRTGGSGHAFDPIVACGGKACQIHRVANDAALKKGQLIVMDVGAEYQLYAADITRTVAFGKPTTRQRDIFKAVQEVQDYAYGQLKPGITIREYEGLIEQKMGEVLRRLKIITSAQREDIRRYYPHATSHFLGLDIHDIGNYDEPLAENMVITVEPGIYLPSENIGVRLEDDVRITKTGIEILSAAIPSEL